MKLFIDCFRLSKYRCFIQYQKHDLLQDDENSEIGNFYLWFTSKVVNRLVGFISSSRIKVKYWAEWKVWKRVLCCWYFLFDFQLQDDEFLSLEYSSCDSQIVNCLISFISSAMIKVRNWAEWKLWKRVLGCNYFLFDFQFHFPNFFDAEWSTIENFWAVCKRNNH